MADSFPQTDQLSVNNRLVGYGHNTLYGQQTRTLMATSSNYPFAHTSHVQLPNSHFSLNNSYVSHPAPNLNLPLHDLLPTPQPIVENTEIKTEIKQEIRTETDPSTSQTWPADDIPEPGGEIDIQIKNMTCHFVLPMHINLRQIALSTVNCSFDRSRGALTMQRRKPSCFIKIFSSGVVYIVGCKTEADCKKVARNISRKIQRLMGRENDTIRMRNYQVKNILAVCRMPFGIKILDIARLYPKQARYEPELYVGLQWTSIDPKANLRIYTTGTIMVTGATSEADVMRVLENISGIVFQHRCKPSAGDQERIEFNRKRESRKRTSGSYPLSCLSSIKRSRSQAYNTGISSGMVGNKMYFEDEDEEFLDDI